MIKQNDVKSKLSQKANKDIDSKKKSALKMP